MKSPSIQKKRKIPVVLNRRAEEIIREIYFYRYMTALDIANLLFSPSSLTYVRSILSDLAGGGDYINNQYLYRFPLPTGKTGNREKVYTLGSKGRDFLAHELGIPVNWYFRPYKVKHLGHSQLLHNLILTRFLVAAKRWSELQPDFKLEEKRICYEIASNPISITTQGQTTTIKVIPDAWLLFRRFKNGDHHIDYPVLIEIDRGMEYQKRFKNHICSRIEYIRSGEYKRVFGVEAVTVAYATAGERPEYRDARLRSMRIWTQEVLKELDKENWASIFRFHSLRFEDIYNGSILQERVWYRPDSEPPVMLFAN
jgi:hypothetical protein